MTDPISLPFLEQKPSEKVGALYAPTFSVIGRGKILGEKVQIYSDPDEPLFHGQEICELLGIGDFKRALKRLDDDERIMGKADSFWHGQRVIFITESGLYTLILESRKPEAKVFKRWITHEVLPSLRRYGQYPPPKRLPAAEPLKLTAQLEALLPAEVKQLPLRRQMIIAERLYAARLVELAPHPSLNKKIRHVITHGLGRRRGWSFTSIYRFHRAYTKAQCDWRVLDTRFELSGRRKKLEAGQ